MTDFALLDNPIWHSLSTVHQSMARSYGLARRYPSDVSPLAALSKPTSEAFVHLTKLVAVEQKVGLFTSEPLEVPDQWEVVRTRWIDQMICVDLNVEHSIPLVELGPADVPEMLELTAATDPGPFLPQTVSMGRYFGIRSHDGRLVAMAGERLQLDEFTEISAVCTDPEFRGRGYARKLMELLMAQMFAAKKIPFLHVKSENNAKALYEKLGFRLRQTICLTVITPR